MKIGEGSIALPVLLLVAAADDASGQFRGCFGGDVERRGGFWGISGVVGKELGGMDEVEASSRGTEDGECISMSPTIASGKDGGLGDGDRFGEGLGSSGTTCGGSGA